MMRVIIEKVLDVTGLFNRIYDSWGMEGLSEKILLKLRTENWEWVSKMPFKLFFFSYIGVSRESKI